MMKARMFFPFLSIFLFLSSLRAASEIKFQEFELDIARRLVGPSFSVYLKNMEGFSQEGPRENRYLLSIKKYNSRGAFYAGKHDESDFKEITDSQYNSLIEKFMEIDFTAIVQSYEDDYRPIDTSNWKVKGYGPGYSIDYWLNCPMLRKSAHTLAAFVSELDDLTEMDLLAHVIPAGSEMDKWRTEKGIQSSGNETGAAAKSKDPQGGQKEAP